LIYKQFSFLITHFAYYTCNFMTLIKEVISIIHALLNSGNEYDNCQIFCFCHGFENIIKNILFSSLYKKVILFNSIQIQVLLLDKNFNRLCFFSLFKHSIDIVKYIWGICCRKEVNLCLFRNKWKYSHYVLNCCIIVDIHFKKFVCFIYNKVINIWRIKKRFVFPRVLN